MTLSWSPRFAPAPILANCCVGWMRSARSLVIEKRGTPKAVLLSIQDYVRLAAPEPEVLRGIGEESQRKGTNTLSLRRIDQVIKATRAKTQARMIPLRLVID